ncbi:tRNA dihydrouridine(20/20a) synthase DusA [Beggiatoa leptomitoformis]|uniref:tRNA-dihydrouridine(20/20a) synthase n=1 Tax=Beggiatoa leptomitoformis TaxID=288004 RepID=A0A2N9YFX5_9GAMM|nr:tRNA dihydrouridine(20/20a) synthase DusA [Beggiatoa leptomitoformis]ALG68285.1 tRNA dihydrouridine(20/20a) synthase DusA [Beggiatoa leptomitoformis]AUI69404.1 tRNA dihydrouridine(20/20a) synthase DusA [Beggiatoa leptomitoformis]
MLNRLVAVAPMLDWTDRHDRYFLRLISPSVLLYSEMVTTGAILYGDRDRFLRFHPAEYPVALQLGGSDPHALAECAKIAEAYGYAEINLNVGCPSDRVQSGQFGACLMATPALVADCVASMRSAVKIPVTVKSRIGIDDLDSYEHLTNFIQVVAKAGCDTFIVHARKAWLTGLSPKENRDIPPLRYDIVHRLKADFPHLTIIINGGLKTIADIEQQLQVVNGVMIGREAYQNPYLLAEIEQRFFNSAYRKPTRYTIVEQMIPYITDELDSGRAYLSNITRHLFGLFQGECGAKQWRRYLSEHAPKRPADAHVVRQALIAVEKIRTTLQEAGC